MPLQSPHIAFPEFSKWCSLKLEELGQGTKYAISTCDTRCDAGYDNQILPGTVLHVLRHCSNTIDGVTIYCVVDICGRTERRSYTWLVFSQMKNAKLTAGDDLWEELEGRHQKFCKWRSLTCNHQVS